MPLAQYTPVFIDDFPETDPFPFVVFTALNGRIFPLVDGGEAISDEVRQKLRQNDNQWAFLAEEDFAGFLRLLYGFEHSNKSIPRLRYLHDHYFPVEGAALKLATTFPCFLFTLNDSIEPVLLLAPNQRIVGDEVTQEEVNANPLWIHRQDIKKYQSYLHQSWDDQATVAPLNYEGGILLRMDACMVTYSLFQRTDFSQTLQDAHQTVTNLHTVMRNNMLNYYSFLKVSDIWFNTFIHSVNVAVLAMGLGMELGLNDQQVETLGLGGLLHDIGNLDLDPNLLLSSERFSKREREKFQDHVKYGFDFCRQNPQIPEQVTRIVAQHHERYDGSGYLQGIAGNQLDELSQIVGLMEVYEAMTNRQPFRPAFTPFQSYCKIINMGTAFRQDLLRHAIMATGRQERWQPRLADGRGTKG